MDWCMRLVRLAPYTPECEEVKGTECYGIWLLAIHHSISKQNRFFNMVFWGTEYYHTSPT